MSSDNKQALTEVCGLQ